MSSFNSIGLLVALGIATMFVYSYLDRLVQAQTDAIVAGVVRGVLGRNVSVEEVRLFAYLVAFLAAVTALAWIVLAPFWYLHLASVLREAEAD